MTVINAIIAGIALILSIINTWWLRQRPRLTIAYRDEVPFKKFLRIIEDPEPQRTETFVRVRVRNEKPILAKACTGKIVQWYTDAERVESFDPIRLHWVSNRYDDYSPIDLAYREFEYLDILTTITSDKRIRIYTNTHERGTPYTFEPGDHVFQVAVYSANESSVSAWFRVTCDTKKIHSSEPWISMAELRKDDPTVPGFLEEE